MIRWCSRGRVRIWGTRIWVRVRERCVTGPCEAPPGPFALGQGSEGVLDPFPVVLVGARGAWGGEWVERLLADRSGLNGWFEMGLATTMP